MSLQLYQAFEKIKDMNYFRNDHARSGTTDHGHETAVIEKFKETGFTEVDKQLFKGLRKGLLKTWAETGNEIELREKTLEMPLGSFICQPGGSQGFPDVLVRDFNDRYIAVECKSGKDGRTPMWNDNLPKPNAIYILSSGHYNKTTLFLGRDVLDPRIPTNRDKLQETADILVRENTEKNLLVDTFERGFVTKFRQQHFQIGGSHMTDYFIHKDRIKCEINVLEFALQ